MQQKVLNLKTDVKMESSMILTNHYFTHMFSNSIAVPVQVSTSRFLLDFDESLKLIADEENAISEELKKTLLYVLSRSYNRLDTDEIVAEMKAMGVKVSPDLLNNRTEEEVLSNFCQKIQDRIASLAVESGMSNLLLQDVLSDRTNTVQLNALSAVDMTAVSGIVRWTQEFYAMFVKQERGDQLTSLLSTRSAKDPLLSGAKSLYHLFRSGSGAYVSARENYIMDELFHAMLGKKIVTTDSLLENKIYMVKGGILPSLQFVDAIGAYIWSLNTIQGLVIAVDDEENFSSVASMVDQIVTGIGDRVPFVPLEAGDINEGGLKAHYQIIYLYHLIKRFMHDQPGDFANRVKNKITTNRFFKAEGLERLFDEELYVLSCCFEAFRDTAAFYRTLYKTENILFSDWRTLAPKRRKQLVKFIEEYLLSGTGDFTYSIDHPAFYKQVANLAGPESSELLAAPMRAEMHIAKDAWNSSQHYILSGAEETFLRLGTGGILNGSWWDLPTNELPYGRRLLNRALPVKPFYTHTVMLSDILLKTAVVKHFYGFYPMNYAELTKMKYEHPEIYEVVRSKAQERRFTRVTDLSMAMGIPLEIAEIVWAKAGEEKSFLDISSMGGITYVFPNEQMKLYDYRELPDVMNRAMIPFVADHPLLVEEIDAAYSIEALPDPYADVKFVKRTEVPIAKKDIPSSTEPTDTADNDMNA